MSVSCFLLSWGAALCGDHEIVHPMTEKLTELVAVPFGTYTLRSVYYSVGCGHCSDVGRHTQAEQTSGGNGEDCDGAS